jgi:hypothetical protein
MNCVTEKRLWRPVTWRAACQIKPVKESFSQPLVTFP